MSDKPSSRQKMRVVDVELVETMTRALGNRPASTVMEFFGISVNSWNKIRQGEPIRLSVADRLEARISGQVHFAEARALRPAALGPGSRECPPITGPFPRDFQVNENHKIAQQYRSGSRKIESGEPRA
jgi:hypothetical protein